MARVLDELSRLPWSSYEIPLGFRRAAVELERLLDGEEPQALARGFIETRECLACLTNIGLAWAASGALTSEAHRWGLGGTNLVAASREGRRIVELTAPGRRLVLRLFEEEPSEHLIRRLDALLNPQPVPSFRAYVARG